MYLFISIEIYNVVYYIGNKRFPGKGDESAPRLHRNLTNVRVDRGRTRSKA